jgi:hypothetical protein
LMDLAFDTGFHVDLQAQRLKFEFKEAAASKDLAMELKDSGADKKVPRKVS